MAKCPKPISMFSYTVYETMMIKGSKRQRSWGGREANDSSGDREMTQWPKSD